uniref:DNA-directed RNA polymerase subunit beta' n=1 Tax=Ilumatobacter sp. TaxID=1967498 RepID=UPI0037503F82
MLDVNMFDQLKIGLAEADQIRNWSHGEVKKPETINYRTLRPEKDGLFCEKIFGPTRDWECYCGKYKRVRFKGIICERCGVEVTRSKVRRDRMGHIELAAPAVHIWYLRGTRSWLAYLLAGIEPKEELKAKMLEKVIYFAAHLVSWVDEDGRHEALPSLEAEYLEELEAINKELEIAIDRRFKDLEEAVDAAEKEGAKPADLKKLQREGDKELEGIRERYAIELDLVARTWDEFKSVHSRKIIEDEMLWREMRDKYGEYFEGGTGAEAIKQLINRIDFDEEEIKLRDAIDVGDSGRKPLSAQRKQKAIKRLKIVASFNRRDENGRRENDPMAMILDVVPVIPPELRPMVQLDGGRFATSDLNDLYRRVINRNNRLERLLNLGAPEIIVNNEKRMLQEAVDALFDNGRRGRPVTGPGNRPLKSLSDMLKGKQGRFRQNLLGKRVDYSGRSVIVAGPTLRLHQCGLPKLMALELFKPFVMKRLVDLELAQNIKTAKRMVERRRPQVWDVLEDVIQEHPVMLNRAPTLHRLGIQAFEPVLVEGKALQIHPLVCTAFNADFDGDQMAIHVPLSAEARAEARVLMLSANNILSPASGRPIVTPSQDLIIGGYYLTESIAGAPGEGRTFRHLWEVLRAYDEKTLDLHAVINIRIPGEAPFETTAGRALFEEALPQRRVAESGEVQQESYPDKFGHIDYLVTKKEMGVIVEQLSDNYSKAEVANALDNIKDLCYRFASQSGITVSIDDVRTPKAKKAMMEEYERQADKVETQFRRGIITDGERRQQEVRIWTDATAEVQAEMEREFKEAKFNPIDM